MFMHKDTQKFSDTLRTIGGKYVKRISSYCSKLRKINACHSDIQNNISYKNWLKEYKYFAYREFACSNFSNT